MFRNTLFALVTIPALILAGCGDGVSDRGDKTSEAWGRVDNAPVNYTLETIASGLDHPWSLAFLPDNNGMLFTERSGQLSYLRPDGSIQPLLDFNTLENHPVHTKKMAQAGLFDVVLHPKFDTNNYIYVSYAAKVDGGSTLFLNRYKLSIGDASVKLSKGETLFKALPSRKQSNHYGGRLIFLSDGTLMFPHGEAFHHREKAQKLDNHFGKMIRLNDDGSVPTGNPFASGKTADGKSALPEIWSYGHRNPQGIILAQDGRVLSHEHGPMGGDEINHIQKGKNYGWPTVSYGLDYSGARISPFEALDGTEQPLIHFTPSIAASGFAQYAGDKFPEWEGDLFVSALALKHVRHINVNADGSLGAQSELFSELDARIRDVRSGPDGYIYILTEDHEGVDGKIIRVTPQ